MIGYINKMEPMFIEIKAKNNRRTPKKGLGLKAEVTGITKEQYKILQEINWCHHDVLEKGYFWTSMKVDDRWISVYLHQIVNNMKWKDVPLWDSTYVEYGLVIDHINNDTLDCRPNNLQYLIKPLNDSKQSHKNTTSKYYGVSKHNNRWRAQYNKNKKRHHIGCYDTEEEAGRAYDKKVKELGLQRVLNFP